MKDQNDNHALYRSVRELEESEQDRLVGELQLEPDRNLLILAESELTFDQVEQALGERPGKLVYVDDRGDALRGRLPARWKLVRLPGWDRRLDRIPWQQANELRRAIYSFENP